MFLNRNSTQPNNNKTAACQGLQCYKSDIPNQWKGQLWPPGVSWPWSDLFEKRRNLITGKQSHSDGESGDMGDMHFRLMWLTRVNLKDGPWLLLQAYVTCPILTVSTPFLELAYLLVTAYSGMWIKWTIQKKWQQVLSWLAINTKAVQLSDI